MNEVQIFNFEHANVRTLMIDNEPYFVGKDVAEILGYSQTAKAIREHVEDVDKGVSVLDTPGGKQQMAVINESGTFDLILDAARQSTNPEIKAKARRFRHTVTAEILPSIRKTGGYQSQPQFNVPQTFPEALRLAANLSEENSHLSDQVTTMKPKAIFADAVNASRQTILVGDLAKMISQNGVEIGQNRLFKWLREKGYLHKQGSQYNRPVQRFIDQGLFKVKESSHANPDGSVKLTFTTKVTGKGQQYFINKFLHTDILEVTK